jgi:hypothetical protein
VDNPTRPNIILDGGSCLGQPNSSKVYLYYVKYIGYKISYIQCISLLTFLKGNSSQSLLICNNFNILKRVLLLNYDKQL